MWDQDIPLDLVPIAVSPDDRFVYTVLPAGDLFQVIRFPIDKSGPPQPLLMLTKRGYGLDVDDKGRIYLDQLSRPSEVLRFDAEEKGPPKRIATTSREWETGQLGPPLELPDGRVLLSSKSLGPQSAPGGRRRLLPRSASARRPGRIDDPRGPRRSPDKLAYLSGPRGHRRLKLVELDKTGVRNVTTLKDFTADGIMNLVASRDGSNLYFRRDGKVREVKVSVKGGMVLTRRVSLETAWRSTRSAANV